MMAIIKRLFHAVIGLPERQRATLLGVLYLSAGFVSLLSIGICNSNPPGQGPVVSRQYNQQHSSTENHASNSNTDESSAIRSIREQRQDPNTSAGQSDQKASFENGCSMGIAESITAFGTIVAAIFVALTWIVYSQIRDHTMEIERAYVGFGTWLSETDTVKNGQRTLEFTLQLFNFGNTPASVKQVVMAYVVGAELDTKTMYKPPFYEGNERIFLVKGGDFFLRQPLHIPDADWQAISQGAADAPTLWLTGYIVYRDRFDRRHRAGFARIYTPGAQTAPKYFDISRTTPESLTFAALENCNYDWEIGDDDKRKKESKPYVPTPPIAGTTT